MEYDSLRKRPTSRATHIVLAVIALVSTCVSIFVNGYSFSPVSKLKDLGLGSAPLWKPANVSQVPAEEWIRYGALGLVYPWQLLWIAYCILQLWYKAENVSVPWKVLATYIVASVLDIALVYATAWGTDTRSALPLGFSVLTVITLYSTVAMAAYHLYTLAPDINAGSRRLAWILVLNGLVAYATWISMDAMLDMDDVILYYSHPSAAITSGTIVLCMIMFSTATYFVLETTVLDRFLRGVFIVYPIVFWTVSGIHTMQAGDMMKRNRNLSLALMVSACGLFVIRIMLQVVFTLFRPLPKYKPDYVLK